MRIGVDIRCLMEDQYSGVGEYTYNLLANLFKVDFKNQYFLFYNASRRVRVPEFNYPNVKVLGLGYPNKIFNFSLKFFNYPKLDKFLGGDDLFFLPNWQFVAWSDKCKKILTVHDLSFKLYPEFFSCKQRLWHKVINPLKIINSVDRIIAVSENTKNDLINIYQVKPEKISAIYSGVSSLFRPIKDQTYLQKIKEKYNLPDDFILYLGTLEPRKNIETLILAFEKLHHMPYAIPARRSPPEADEGGSHKLVIAGGKGWGYKKIYQIAKKSKVRDKIKFLGYVTSEDKPALYNLAKLFVYPSFYEGFGFPPLEAMACGTPVICSFSSSLSEIVGSAGIMIDPYNISDLTEAIKQVLGDSQLQQKLKERGLKQAQKFSWQTTAGRTLEVFNNLFT